MLNFFATKPVLDNSSTDWLFDGFAWALENFDATLFHNSAQLVLPNNTFFPGRTDSVEGMAELIFDQVKQHAAISHWPTLLLDQNTCGVIEQPKVPIAGALRGPKGVADNTVAAESRLLIPYNPEQINNPEGMIATYAHIISHYMVQLAKSEPPGGPEFLPQATELLAVYLGFGLMFANSAYNFRGGCASCYNPNAQRDAYLSEFEATYSLAIFATLKGLPNSKVTPHLKKYLRSFYKNSVKDIQNRQEDLQHLKSFT